jgi:large conductance mechanosensitive channel
MAKTSMVTEFVKFVKEQGVVGLAVGLAIGGAAGDAVKAIVDGFINPIVGFIVGGSSLEGEKLSIVKPALDGTGRSLELGWGMIVSAVITLLATAFVVYYIVDKAGLTKLDAKKEK